MPRDAGEAGDMDPVAAVRRAGDDFVQEDELSGLLMDRDVPVDRVWERVRSAVSSW